MVCRNKDKAEEARADIVNESGNTVSGFETCLTVNYKVKLLKRIILGGVRPRRGHVPDT